MSSISGVDYVESSSVAGLSTVTVRLKLNHSSTVALAEVGNRLDQIRSELPAEAESPVVEVQRADRPYATFYVSVTSATMTPPQLTDYVSRQIQPRLSTIPDVQRVSLEGARPQAMRIWLDADGWRDSGSPLRRPSPLSPATTSWPRSARSRAARFRSTSLPIPTCAASRNSSV